ncbi:MAG: HD domain-containing phosphohydrolase, partial [Eubacteriales bacterium]
SKQEFTLNTWSHEVMKDCKVQDQPSVYQLDKTGVWGEAVRQKKPLIINDFKIQNPLKKGVPDGHIHFTRFMTIPVLSGRKIVAVVGLADKEGDYSEIDVLQLTILMDGVWKEVSRKRNEAALFEEKERLRVTLLSVGDGVITTDIRGNIQLMNGVAEKLTGWTLKEARKASFNKVFNIINEYTRRPCENPVQTVLDTGIIIGLANHTILISKDGHERSIADSAAPIKQMDGQTSGVVLVFRDVTIQMQKQAMIEHLSFHDQLTDLFNRHFFEEEMRRLDTQRNLPLAIIMADVNGLKLTNDAFGHSAGDQLLVGAAETIQACCRRDDIISRLGGDEFVVLLPKTDMKEAEAIAKRIMSACAKTNVDAVSLSLSCGWDVKVDMDDKIYDVLKRSEDKMYHRKLFEGPSIRGQIIEAIVKALYEANAREKMHSERVSIICEQMGIALGCHESELQELKSAGLLHDIGKVAIDVSIIDKPGKLSEIEWIEVRRHSEIGYRILSAVNDMSRIAESVLSHHERWDGTGYPRRIAGENIPLYARILGIADAYDAMTCERPYRETMTKQQAQNEIALHSGTQFDAKLAKIFIEKVLPVLD